MPAGKPPGPAPEKHGPTVKAETKEDVKPISASSRENTEAKPQVEAKPEATTEDLDEKDLEQLEAQKIPYSRFKEVNARAKAAEEKLQASEKRYQDELKRSIEDAELRIESRLRKQREEEEAQEGLDPSERSTRRLEDKLRTLEAELKTTKAETSRATLENRIERLEARYPEADTTAVLAIAKHLGKTSHEDIEELMEQSHVKIVDKAKAQLEKLLEDKKKRAKSAVPVREGAIRLKEEEKPKTMQEARRKLMEYFRD